MENYLQVRAFSKVLMPILGLFLFGGISLYKGCESINASSGSLAEPTVVDLYDMENGVFQDNRHMTIGPHVAFCGFSVGQYYPIMSLQNGLGELDEVTYTGAELDDLPETMVSRLRNCRVYVKSSSRPGRFVVRESVTGLVTHFGDSLPRDVKALITKQHNVRDFENILVLEEGREPNYGTGMLLLVVGIGLTLVAFAISYPLLRWAANAEG